ncbi:unnamed protein product [Angiostrongylus costaricensis]|uniref:PBPe domain-containing protein n=1 Tax=Angiostrongylus costaricensis TaxID=334426 RepID=A0A0R3PQA8_ANGCS|nr:unnamed protein product [Angiostrongylus costaricensis]
MAWIQNLKNWERLQDSAEYMKQVYGDPYSYMNPDTTKFVTEREYFGDFGYGECFNSTDSSVQCEIITGQFDPKLLPYEKRMAWHFKEFCYKTSAHGIPMIGQAPNRYYRAIWVILFLGCMTMLYMNAQSVLEKYRRNEKIVDIQLKFGTFTFVLYHVKTDTGNASSILKHLKLSSFRLIKTKNLLMTKSRIQSTYHVQGLILNALLTDTAPFPAITLCNLNPYKASLATSVDLVKRTVRRFINSQPKKNLAKFLIIISPHIQLSAFDGAMEQAGEKQKEASTDTETVSKTKREIGLHAAFFEPVSTFYLLGIKKAQQSRVLCLTKETVKLTISFLH